MAPPFARSLSAALLLLPLLLIAACASPDRAGEDESREVTVFAAASLRDVAADWADAFARTPEGEGLEVTFNFAGSNTLARQIQAAPAADAFLSADRRWVRELEEGGLAVPGSVRPLLSNRLVVIARRGARPPLSDLEELARLPYRFLVLADPDAVPAGRYARSALEKVPYEGGNLWESVSPRVAPALDVRAALAMVRAEPETVGIVYATDAATTDDVEVLAEIPPELASAVYWGAAVEGSPNPRGGRRWLAFLESPEALAVARRHGFLPPPDGGEAAP